MIQDELVKKTEDYVRSLFAQNTKELYYHNFEHTSSVVEAVNKITAHYHQLSPEDLLALKLTAWFHDTGYLFVGKKEHETKSVEIAETFLKQQKADEQIIQKVKKYILATRMPQRPENLPEEIICDADLFDLGTDRFAENNKNVRKELEEYLNREMTGEEWRSCSVDLLKLQVYKTDYCRGLLREGLEKNIRSVLEKQEKKDKKEGKKDKKNKEPFKSDRGIETMFRTTSTNHLRLSEMADNKANIMITVNSIIISVLLTVLFRKLENDPRFLIPSMLLLFTSLTTIVFSIFVTRPNVTTGMFSKEDIQKKRANLLFFGNFHKMKLEDYEWGIQQVMQDSEFLYGSMTRDIYNLGVVLGRKYKMLRIAYSFFMFGFVISVLSFVIVVIPYSR